MKSRRNFNEAMFSEKWRKENPTSACGTSFIKLINSLYKSRLMIIAFVLGNLLMVSTGYGYNVEINNSTTVKNNGDWNNTVKGPYVFTPKNNLANINALDIIERLNGTKQFDANTVTINTGTSSGNVTISSAITGNNMSPTFTIIAEGSIQSTAAITAGNIVLTSTAGINISANITAGGTITLTNGAAGGQTAGIISGGSFIKQGAGTFQLGGESTLTALTISAGNLTIPAGAQVTVAGETAINVANGLTIESLSELNGGAGTGSFITGTATTTTPAGTVTTTVRRHMSPRKWHIVSSPVSGKTISEFLAENTNIPTNNNNPTERGMRGYEPSTNQWTDFYTTTTEGNIETGKGFLVRVKGTPTYKEVIFNGQLQAGNQSANGLAYGKWNCVGNPYTSALKLNSTGTADNFLDVNTANLDMTFGGIYIWKQANEALNDAEATGAYEPVTNASELYEVQQGQAFMVKMKDVTSATTLSFTRAMQSHNTGLALKSTKGIWPTIKLTATADSITSSTIVAFHEGMTAGLDPTYDAGLLKGGAPVEVYTRLVEDNGIAFDIQALPPSEQTTIVPVGIDCTQGGQVSFSARLMHLPAACQVMLEDRQTNTFTDLSVDSYTADLMGSAVSENRFFLHTTVSTTGIVSDNQLQNLRAWAVSNREIKISGEVSHQAIATLYDLQGRTVAVSPLQEGTLNNMSLKGLKQGVYLLRVQDNSRVQVLKVMLGKD